MGCYVCFLSAVATVAAHMPNSIVQQTASRLSVKKSKIHSVTNMTKKYIYGTKANSVSEFKDCQNVLHAILKGVISLIILLHFDFVL